MPNTEFVRKLAKIAYSCIEEELQYESKESKDVFIYGMEMNKDEAIKQKDFFNKMATSSSEDDLKEITSKYEMSTELLLANPVFRALNEELNNWRKTQ